MTTIIQWLLSAFICLSLAMYAYRSRASFAFVHKVYDNVTYGDVRDAILMCVLVIPSWWVLSHVPVLRWGWTNLFSTDSFNITLAPVTLLTSSTNVFLTIFVLLFVAALIAIMPLLTHAEEIQYRKGRVTWVAIWKSSVHFGFVHCLVGIPLAGGIALCLAGLFLGYRYKQTFESVYNPKSGRGFYRGHKEAVFATTVCHTTYNVLILGFLFMAISTLALIRK